MRTRAGSVRINPVGLNRVAAPPQRYGDCKAVGRETGRLSIAVCERAARPPTCETPEAGRWYGVWPVSGVAIEPATLGEAQRFPPDGGPPWSTRAGERTGVMTYPVVQARARRSR
jgi:hypothetical protein